MAWEPEWTERALFHWWGQGRPGGCGRCWQQCEASGLGSRVHFHAVTAPLCASVTLPGAFQVPSSGTLCI